MHSHDVTESTLEGFLTLPWTWAIEDDADDPGTFVVTIAEMPDFFAAGRGEAEAWGNARDALLAYVESYLSTGTPIPMPAAAPPWQPEGGVAASGAVQVAAPQCI
jgi:predicted RNase H-like HicB family nuclease